MSQSWHISECQFAKFTIPTYIFSKWNPTIIITFFKIFKFSHRYCYDVTHYVKSQSVMLLWRRHINLATLINIHTPQCYRYLLYNPLFFFPNYFIIFCFLFKNKKLVQFIPPVLICQKHTHFSLTLNKNKLNLVFISIPQCIFQVFISIHTCW